MKGDILKNQFGGKKFKDLNYSERKAFWKACYRKDPKRHHRNSKRWISRLWDEFFSHYGDSCVCCGESNRVFLTVEHLDGGGGIHRRNRPGGVDKIIVDIKRAGWPENYTTLCMNCNFGKWRNGGACPHVVEKARKFLSEICEIQKEIDGHTAKTIN